MSDLINREQAIHCVENIAQKIYDAGKYVEYQALNSLTNALRQIPTAKSKLEIHAHWYMRGGRACCSNCNVKSLWESDWDGCKNHEREFVSAKSNYCPNCGAIMDEQA